MIKVFVNSNNEIKDVGSTTDETLKLVEIPNGFCEDWSVAKLLCYKMILNNGQYAGYTPYVDSRIIEHIDRLAKQTEQNTSDVTDAQLGLMETYEQTELNTEEITNIQLAIMELYEATAE